MKKLIDKLNKISGNKLIEFLSISSSSCEIEGKGCTIFYFKTYYIKRSIIKKIGKYQVNTHYTNNRSQWTHKETIDCLEILLNKSSMRGIFPDLIDKDELDKIKAIEVKQKLEE